MSSISVLFLHWHSFYKTFCCERSLKLSKVYTHYSLLSVAYYVNMRFKSSLSSEVSPLGLNRKFLAVLFRFFRRSFDFRWFNGIRRLILFLQKWPFFYITLYWFFELSFLMAFDLRATCILSLAGGWDYWLLVLR